MTTISVWLFNNCQNLHHASLFQVDDAFGDLTPFQIEHQAIPLGFPTGADGRLILIEPMLVIRFALCDALGDLKSSGSHVKADYFRLERVAYRRIVNPSFDSKSKVEPYRHSPHAVLCGSLLRTTNPPMTRRECAATPLYSPVFREGIDYFQRKTVFRSDDRSLKGIQRLCSKFSS